jgi:hypothetical protein
VVPQDKSGRVRLPLTWRGARRTIDFGSFRLRHLCLEIGLRARTRGTLLVTSVGSFHHSKIMFGVLVKVLCVDAIATCRRLPTKGDVAVKNLMRIASDFDVGTVTIEGLTSVRYLLPITVAIVTVIATMRSAGLSWSHDTYCVDEEIESLSNESVSEHFRTGGGRCACTHGAPPPSRGCVYRGGLRYPLANARASWLTASRCFSFRISPKLRAISSCIRW